MVIRRHMRTTPERWWDLPAAFLLFIILTIAFTRLIVTDWTSALPVTRVITYLGLIAGIALGMSRFSPRLSLVIAILYGTFVIPWRIGLTLGEGIAWQERLTSLVGRLNVIIRYLLERRAVPDNLLFVVLMAILFWVLAVHAGYNLTRHANPWAVILPTGIALVLIHSYDSFFPGRIWFLVAYLFFGVLLVARLVYLQNRARWSATKTYVPPYLGLDFIRITVILGVILSLLAWAAPALAENLPVAQQAWQRLKQPLHEVRNTLDNAFSSLRSSVGIASEFYGATTSLGRGSYHTNTEVFTVITPEQAPLGARYYWRARVYDRYDNGQWSSSLDTTQGFVPENVALPVPTFANQNPGFFSFIFTAANPLTSLFTVNQPVWISRPARLELSANPDGTLDLGHFRATPSIRAGESYTTRSRLANITVAAMRAAGTDYPDWVVERYLDLPDSITPRTIQLAKDITAGMETPYDKAAAITSYLRNTIQYTEVITEPFPINQEPIDWFLFDLRKGFCNYYATSEVILLRAVGVPARIAYGYAEGELLEGTTTYVVRQRDAHAWPEVFFPNLGWVEFEPTTFQRELNRPLGEAESNQNNDQPIPQPTAPLSSLQNDERREGLADSAVNERFSLVGILILGSVMGLTALLAFLVIPLIRRKGWLEHIPHVSILMDKGLRRMGIKPPPLISRWAHRVSLSPIARAYLEINLALSRIGKNPGTSFTPAERARALQQALPPAAPAAEIILNEYQLSTYSHGYTPNLVSAQRASALIRRLSLRAFFLRLLTQTENRSREAQDRVSLEQNRSGSIQVSNKRF